MHCCNGRYALLGSLVLFYCIFKQALIQMEKTILFLLFFCFSTLGCNKYPPKFSALMNYDVVASKLNKTLYEDFYSDSVLLAIRYNKKVVIDGIRQKFYQDYDVSNVKELSWTIRDLIGRGYQSVEPSRLNSVFGKIR